MVTLPGVPEGYRAVRYGVPGPDDLFMLSDGQVTISVHQCRHHYLIVEKLPPAIIVPKGVISPGWIAEDNRMTWWCIDKPTWREARWRFPKASYLLYAAIHPWLRWPAELPDDQRIVEVTE